MLLKARADDIEAEIAFSPLFYGIRDVTGSTLSYLYDHVRLSVPYFTGFVMLHWQKRREILLDVCFQSPILRDS